MLRHPDTVCVIERMSSDARLAEAARSRLAAGVAAPADPRSTVVALTRERLGGALAALRRHRPDRAGATPNGAVPALPPAH